jgi:N utilization substance protein A
MNGELVRLVDSIHRDKDIDKALIYQALEDALVSAARKHFGQRDTIAVKIDRETGQISAMDGAEVLDPAQLGRIAAQTAKQVIIQKIKEAESDVIYSDFEGKMGDIVNGTVQRVEGPNVMVNLGRVEGILPRREQVRDETYRVGERIKCLVLDVKRIGQRVRILLSRANGDIVRRLFEIEVPEVTERIIEIKQLAREPGVRTKIAVTSHDMKVDCVGACVGVRGSRIKNIVAELGGEKIDIVRFSEQPEAFIANALNPAEISNIILNGQTRRAKVIVAEDQLSLAIGKRGQNVRLAAKLTGWDIDVMSQAQHDERRARTRDTFAALPNVGEGLADQIIAAGYHLQDVAVATPEQMTQIEGIDATLAAELIRVSREVVDVLKREQAERAAKKAAEAAAGPAPLTAAERLFATIDAKDSAEAPAEQAEGAEPAPPLAEPETERPAEPEAPPPSSGLEP